MIIEEEYGNDYYGNLVIQNYPNLQSINVKNGSLQNLNSLKICNCEKLKTIEIEDGEGWRDSETSEEFGKWHSNGSFKKVKTVEIESI